MPHRGKIVNDRVISVGLSVYGAFNTAISDVNADFSKNKF